MEITQKEKARLFASVINCRACSICQTISRGMMDLPQPGHIGMRYRGILLVGRNPCVDPTGRWKAQDSIYFKNMSELGQRPDESAYSRLEGFLVEYIKTWPICTRYFPLKECGLELDDIAYVNLVRCRTVGDKTPQKKMTANCINNHFLPWVEKLKPNIIVFVGKWAADRVKNIEIIKNIDCCVINRKRSLNGAQRAINRSEIVNKVRSILCKRNGMRG